MKRKYTETQDTKPAGKRGMAVLAVCMAAALPALAACGGENQSDPAGNPGDAEAGNQVSSGTPLTDPESASNTGDTLRDPESASNTGDALRDPDSAAATGGGHGGDENFERIMAEAELPQPYAGYMEILEQIRTEGRDPGGREYHSDKSWDIGNNCFAILDVDDDGRQELIFNFNESYMGAMCEVVYEYDAETDTLHEELVEWVSTEYYHDGLVKVQMSHNHGKDPEERGIWPYMVYRYDEEQDSYQLLYTVDGWDGRIYGEDFPDELDTDGDKLLYCVTTEAGSEASHASADISLNGSGGTSSGDDRMSAGEDIYAGKVMEDGKKEQIGDTMFLNREDYESWAEELLPEWSRIDVAYHPLTEESMERIRSAYGQAEVYAAQADIWFVGEEAGSAARDYLLYDLDGDGSLELMTSVMQGTGRYSYNYFYGLTDKGKVTELQLIRLCNSKERDWNADFDIVRTRVCAYRDGNGIIYYEGNDYVRDGIYGGYDETGFYYLKGGVLYQDSIRRRTEFFGGGAGCQEEEIHYYGMEEDEEKYISNEEITKEQYEAIREEYVRNMTEIRVYQNWEYFTWEEITKGGITEEIICLRLFDSFLGSG